MKLSKKMAAMMAAAALLSGVQMAAADTTYVNSKPLKAYTTNVDKNNNSEVGAVGKYYIYTYGGDPKNDPNRQKTNVTFSHMNFTDNKVTNTGTTAQTSDTSGGAAVFIKGADVTFNDVGFTGNTVTSKIGEQGALSNGGAVFVDSTRNNHNYDASVTFNVTKGMAYTGNKVIGDSKYSDTYGNIATTSGGFLYMDRGTTANFNINEGATLTIGKEGEKDDNTDSIASSIKKEGQPYSENAINKKGKGTLTVNGSMSGYHGNLNVTEGTMNINHSLAGDANISVSGRATLNLKKVELSSQSGTLSVVDTDGITKTVPLPEKNGSLLAEAGSNVTADTITLKDKSSMKVDTGATVTADSVAVNGTLSNAGTVEATDSITVDGGFFENTGKLTTGTLTISGHASDQSEIAGEIYAGKEFLYKGIDGNLAAREVTASIHTPVLHILGNTHQTGFKIEGDNVLKDVDKIIIESNNNTRTGLVFDGDVHVKSNIELTGTPKDGKTDARIEINNGKSVQIDQLTSKAAKGLVQVNGTGSVKLDSIDAQQGRMVLQTNGNEKQQGSYELQNIHVGKNASFEMCVYGANSPAEITGQIQAHLDKGAKIDFGGMHAKDWKPDKINVAADSVTVHIADASSGNKVYISGKSDILKQPSHVAVVADGNNNTGNATKDLQAISNVVQVTTQTADSTWNTSKTASGVKVTQEASRIFDEASGVVETKENGRVAVGQLTTKKNPFSYGVSDTNALSLMTWRAEMNDMNKRMGELRDSKGEHGIWARMVRGRTEYGSVSNQYNQYQLGYDRTLGTENTWTLGGAVTYTEGDSAYGAGSFLDLIAKYARLDDDYKTIWGNGSGDTNGFSVSAEYGKRFTQDTGFWVEQQAELIYGRVSSMSYHLGDISVDQDGINSLVGRLGFSLGKNIKKGNVYARASYLYDFDGDTSVHFTDGGSLRTLKQDLGGGWWEVGIGTNLNLSDIAHFYFDIEKTFGGDIAIPWQWNAGIRWSF